MDANTLAQSRVDCPGRRVHLNQQAEPDMLHFSRKNTDLYFMALIAVFILIATGCANAGKDQSVDANTVVTLDASASTSDYNGKITKYHWKQIRGTRVKLSDTSVVSPTFIAPDVKNKETLTFIVSVTETESYISPHKTYDTVNVVVNPVAVTENKPPVALAEVSSSTIEAGQSVTLNASNSTDSDGQIVSYVWRNDASEILSNDASFTQILSDAGTYGFTVTVTDDKNATDSDTVTVTVTQPADTTPPTITLLGDNPMSVTQNSTYTDPGATATDDVDGNVAVAITGDVDTSTAGSYTLTYTATDSAGNSASESRIVNVVVVNGTARLGSLAKANVEIYEVGDDGGLTLKWHENTSNGDALDEIGKFNLHVGELDRDRFYLYKVIGGEDWDVDNDGIKDTTSTRNRGTIRAIAKGIDIVNIGDSFKVTIVSEILYEKIVKTLKYDFKGTTFGDMLNQKAGFIVEDIDGDGDIDNHDILKYDPVINKANLKELYRLKLNEILDIVHQGKVILLNIDSIIAHIDTAGRAKDVVLLGDGTKAYVVDDDGLAVLDITDPANPVKLGIYDTAGGAEGVALSGDGTKAYVAAGESGLVVLDITDPANPVQFGAYDARDAQDVTLSDDGTKAYVADGTGLVVLDITDPANPVRLGAYDTYHARYRVLNATLSNDGTKAYVANLYDGLAVVDITDPANPVELGAYGDADIVRNVALSSDGTKLYLASAIGLVAVDITDPANPVRLGAYDTAGRAQDVTLSGDGTKAYVADGKAGLVVLDITDPANPVELRAYDTAGNASGVALSGDGTKAYVADGGNGLVVVDITDPADPVKFGSYRTEDNKGGVANGITLSSDSTKAYVAVSYYDSYREGDGGLVVVDITDPANPVKLGFQSMGSFARSATLSSDGTKVYMANVFKWGSGFVVVDITDPANPSVKGGWSADNWWEAADVTPSKDGTKAYVAGGRTGLVVVDMRYGNPIEIRAYDTAGSASGVTLSDDGSKAYVADGKAGLVVVDITDPANPVELGAYDTAGNAWHVTLSGDGTKAYVADGGNGLVVMDITDSANPVQLGAYDTAGSAQDVTLSGDGTKAYVADGGNGLVVVDITDPANPVELRAYDTAGYALNVALSGDSTKAYVADRGDGLVIIDLELYD